MLYKQFQNAYSSDSYEGSDWNEICEAVGLDSDTDRSNDDNMNEIEKVVQVEVIDTNKNDDEMSQETDGKGELRAKMKEFRKILKTARKQLCGDGDEDLHEMYKSYKQCARSVKKQFKKLLGKDDVTSEHVPDIKTEETNDATTSHKMTSKGEMKVDGRPVPSTSDVITHRMEQGGKIRRRKRRRDGLPTSFTFHGQMRHKYLNCDFVGRSFGKVYSHMVTDHGAELLLCKKCSFKTANPTSLHNHTKRYCSKRDME